MVERAHTVVLRDERDGADSRHLVARVDADGNLCVEGHDLGPATAELTGGDEYEWLTIVAVPHLPALVALLGGEPGFHILDLLEQRYTGAAAGDLEAVLSGGSVPIERHVWGG